MECDIHDLGPGRWWLDIPGVKSPAIGDFGASATNEWFDGG